MELSNLKHLQRYMTSFELDFRSFDHQLQSNQLSITLSPSMKLIFETLEIADVDMNPSHSMIVLFINRNYGNTFQHQNGPNHHQNTHKHSSKQYQHRKTIKQCQHRNTGQHHQQINNNQEYQLISFLIYRTY